MAYKKVWRRDNVYLDFSKSSRCFCVRLWDDQFKRRFRTGQTDLTMEEFQAKTETLEQIRSRIRKRHTERLRESISGVRAIHAQMIFFKSQLANIDLRLEQARLAIFDIWFKITQTHLNDFTRYKSSNIPLHYAHEESRRLEAEARIASGVAFPLYIHIEVKSREALLKLPLDSRFLEKHADQVAAIVEEHQDLNFDQQFLKLTYMSSSGLEPEGITTTKKNKPGVPSEDGIIGI